MGELAVVVVYVQPNEILPYSRKLRFTSGARFVNAELPNDGIQKFQTDTVNAKPKMASIKAMITSLNFRASGGCIAMYLTSREGSPFECRPINPETFEIFRCGPMITLGTAYKSHRLWNSIILTSMINHCAAPLYELSRLLGELLEIWVSGNLVVVFYFHCKGYR